MLPNRIIVSFESDLSNSKTQMLLNRYGLEIIRPLRFTQNRYLVRAKTERRTDVLHLSNRLNGVTGIQSATPNFIQSLTQRVQPQSLQDADLAAILNADAQLEQRLATLPKLEAAFSSHLLLLAWHLNSTPRRGTGLPRTDVRATEAGRISNAGEGTVVTVIDSLIQWDHPDLQQTVYTSDPASAPLPGETHCWDFSNDGLTCTNNQPDSCTPGDPDTRISEEELSVLPRMLKSYPCASLV